MKCKKILYIICILFLSSMQCFAYFYIPFDSLLFLKPLGGHAGASSEFGIVNNDGSLSSYLSSLPRTAVHEVEVGFFSKDTSIDFFISTDWQNQIHTVQTNLHDTSSRESFFDTNNSLGFSGSAIEQVNNSTWLLHLDDAASSDDDDNDLLVQLRLQAHLKPDEPQQDVPEPLSIILMCLSFFGLYVKKINFKK